MGGWCAKAQNISSSIFSTSVILIVDLCLIKKQHLRTFGLHRRFAWVHTKSKEGSVLQDVQWRERFFYSVYKRCSSKFGEKQDQKFFNFIENFTKWPSYVILISYEISFVFMRLNSHYLIRRNALKKLTFSVKHILSK